MQEKLLTQRFKMRVSNAITLLQADELSIEDICFLRSVSDYFQAVARYTRDIGFNKHQQVLWA